jgi:hypothetical protein
MSRDGADADHQAMRDVPAVVTDDPHVGYPMQVWTEDGKLIRTSNVLSVSRSGSDIVVDTLNSRYRLHPMSS